MWRRARPVLLMTMRDLRRRPLRNIFMVVLLTLVSMVGGFAATFMAPATESGGSNMDTWSAVATGVVFVMGLGVIGLVTAPIHLAAAQRNLRQLGLLKAAGARERDLVATMLAPTALIATTAALIGASIGFFLGNGLITLNDPVPAPIVAMQALNAAAVAIVVVVANLVAAAIPAWRLRSLSVVDALRAQAPTGGRGRRAGLIVAGAATTAGSVGVLLGMPQRSLPVLAPSVLLVWAGASGLLAVAITTLLRRGARGPFSLRYAVADGGRHPGRIVPAVLAGASLVTILVAAMAYVGSTHAAAWERYVPMAPLGSGVVFSFSPSSSGRPSSIDVDTAVAAVADLAPQAGTTPLLVPDTLVLRIDGTLEQVVETEGTIFGSVLIGTEELVAASDLPDEVAEALAAGHIVTRPGVVRPGATTAIVLPGGDRVTEVEEILPVSAPGRILVPPSSALGADMEVEAVGLVVTGLDSGELEQLGQAIQPFGYALAIEQGPPELESAPTQYALLGASAVVVMLVIWLMGALSREESRADVVTLEAVGARPGFTRWAAAWQAGGTGALAALAGAPVGPLAAMLLMAVRDSFYSPALSTPLIVPWLPLLGVIVVTPLVAGLGVALLQPRHVPLVRRLAD